MTSRIHLCEAVISRASARIATLFALIEAWCQHAEHIIKRSAAVAGLRRSQVKDIEPLRRRQKPTVWQAPKT